MGERDWLLFRIPGGGRSEKMDRLSEQNDQKIMIVEYYNTIDRSSNNTVIILNEKRRI